MREVADCNKNVECVVTHRKYLDGGWGWVVVAAGFVFGVIRFGTERSFPVFYLSIMQEYGINFAQVSQLIGAFFIFFGVSGAVAPVLIKRLGCRRCMIVFGIIVSVSCFTASFPGPYWKLILCYGAIPGVCFGVQMIVVFAAVNDYFERKQHLALQLVFLGASAGSFIANPFCEILIQSYAWRGALMIISGIFLHAVAVGATMRPVQSAGQICDQKDATSVGRVNLSSIYLMYGVKCLFLYRKLHSKETCSTIMNRAILYFDLRLFCEPAFYLSNLYILCHCVGLYSSLSFLVPYAVKELDISSNRASMLPSFEAIGETASKLLCGFLFNKIPRRKQKPVVCLIFVVAAALYALLPAIKSYEYLLCVCVAIGLTVGGIDGLYSAFYMQDFGKEVYPSLFGYTNVVAYFSCTVASIFIGHIVDITGDVSNAFYFGSASYGMSCVALFFLHKLKTKTITIPALDST
uniref:monocarboxylate transporter 3 isoform X1 n=1 Tax=Ciona intestinalis TaxID=7719 RepID=UPI000EF4D985|nr:monocarboxylate transporter 3 isoform X1 [Ciona intestinalis]|eukprot:XP_026693269.1 monocarboxylate transporter 3 isoform X1 [Ciona intestinalis]